MAHAVLFGYTIEENDGDIVITVSGPLARQILHGINAGLDGARTLASLPIVVPFGNLASQSVRLSSGNRLPMQTAPDEKLSLKEIFGQGFDRGLSDFEADLQHYRHLLMVEDQSASAATENSDT
ncbi:MAG TPA: hypothetical protein VFE16_02410 [Candidatus Cybelea sp.]|jgi:hypothetical protein|nr:hypothetical protein [Candidatus Cybelea sp.]